MSQKNSHPGLAGATVFWLLAFCLYFSGRDFLRAQASPPDLQSETVTIDASAPSHPFPHYWERMFGSGRAILSLRESYRNDLRAVKGATDFEFIRFHGILDDDVGLYDTDANGSPVYNFSYIDQIYDGLLANGVRPFVELSFMPKSLASTPHQQAFWYHPYVSPPRDWKLWSDLIRNFASHLVARYGLDEVSQWYFEVWNESNIDFWAGEPKQETYFTLYDNTARALKSVSPRLRVGGPATAQAAWISAFIRHCVDHKTPLDFVSTHIYANDTAENVFGTHEQVSRLDMVPRAVQKVHDEVEASPRPDLPIIFSEYNATYLTETDVTDSAFMGPWLAYTISRCDGLVDTLAYWDFSDVFEEQGIVKRPFYGGYGLMAEDNVPKAAFNDFALLHRLGTTRIAVDSQSVLATKRADGAIIVALWNYAPPGESAPEKEFRLSLRNFGDRRRAAVWEVDENHGSALAAWQAMGSPAFPTRGQLELLREAGQLPPPEVRQISSGDPAVFSISLPSHGLGLVEFSR